MAQDRNTRQGSHPISGGQVLIVITLVIGIYFALDLSRQAVVGRRLGVWEKELSTDVARLEAEVETLHGQLQEVNTDAYVERVAREEFRWVRPGDVLVVPLFARQPPKALSDASTASESEPQVEQPRGGRSEAWWKRLLSR